MSGTSADAKVPFFAKDSSSVSSMTEEVIVEITEPMEPCSNLCKLPYINDPSLPSSRERVARCQQFIEALGRRKGLRGWYAKEVQGGAIRVGDSVSVVGIDASA